MSKAGYIRLGATAAAAGYSVYQRYNNRSRASYSEPASMSGGMTVSRARRRTGRLKKRSANQVFRLLQRSGQEYIYRWQQTSREYLGPGRVFIGMGNTDATYDRMPIHFMSLTNCPGGLINLAKGCNNAISMCRVSFNKITGDWAYNGDVQSQTYLGADATDYQWQLETNNATVYGETVNGLFHKYTDIKLNLYGTYSVPIHYTVTLCTMPEQLDPLSFSAANAGGVIAEGTECANMLKDMAVDLLHNNFGKNTSKSTWRKDMKIIKEYKCTIQPLPYSDQQAEQTVPVGYSSAAHIKELKWFIRHDRYRNYKWSRDTAETLEHRDLGLPGWDVIQPRQIMCDVEWGKRVFLIIRASCPQRNGVDPIFMQDAYAAVNGSYDLSIRNSFVFH